MRNIIQHTGHSITTHSDYVAIADGDICAAQLLDILEYYTTSRIELSNQPDSEPGLWIYITIQEFTKWTFGVFGRDRIIKSLNLLIGKGFIEKQNTSLYLLDIEAVQDALNEKRIASQSGSVA